MNTAPVHERIAVIGMGKTGLSVARHLKRMHVQCECFDEANVVLPDDLQGIPMHSGELNSELLGSFDRIIVSPGINWRHPALVAVRGCGIATHGDLDEFLRQYRNDLVAVTGTNGKTTTTQMIALLLETLPGGCDAGGNIGIPMLDLLEGEPPKRVVLELSSFQLERASHLHPNWAVLLNVQPDHADMHESAEAYKAAKLRVFEHMVAGDSAMFPHDDAWNPLAANLNERGVKTARFGVITDAALMTDVKAGVLCTEKGEESLFWTQNEEQKLIPCGKLMVRGHHQQQNIAVAAQAAADFGVSSSVIEEAMMSFQGLEHRLEFVGQAAGRDWFNDSKATNPDAAEAALSSFEKVVWICGGLRKGLSLDGLVDVVKERVSFACIVGKDTAAYEEMLKQAGVEYVVSGNIEQSVKDAAVHGDGNPVLLSPAAASQDQFKSYAERGFAYVKAIRELDNGQKS